MKTLLTLLIGILAVAAQAAPKQVRVFVGLCDNKTQGIVPVGRAIGNGDDPDGNLYWGCADGFGTFFRRSSQWKVTKSEKNVSPVILGRGHWVHPRRSTVAPERRHLQVHGSARLAHAQTRHDSSLQYYPTQRHEPS